MTESTEVDLFDACKAVARVVLWKNGAASSDVVETLARKYLTIAEEYQDYVRRQRESDDVIAYAVQYIAHVHAIPPSGTDTEWFRHTLSTLIEVAVPNTALSESSARLLPCLQEGIRDSLADVPVTRGSLRLEDEDAVTVRRMQDASMEYGVASELLDLLEKIYHGDPLSAEEQRCLCLASVSAPLTRQARLAAGMDQR
jgi:hypothetical protein